MLKRNDKGFTLVELLLATTFFTFILLIITVGFVQVSRTYQSGVITKNAQNTARAVFEQLARDARTGTDIQAPIVNGSLTCHIIGSTIYGFDGAPNYRLYRGNSGCSTSTMQLMHESSLKVYSFNLSGIKALPASGAPSSAQVKILLGVADPTLIDASTGTVACQQNPLALRLCSVISMSTAVTLRGDA